MVRRQAHIPIRGLLRTPTRSHSHVYLNTFSVEINPIRNKGKGKKSELFTSNIFRTHVFRITVTQIRSLFILVASLGMGNGEHCVLVCLFFTDSNCTCQRMCFLASPSCLSRAPGSFLMLCLANFSAFPCYLEA